MGQIIINLLISPYFMRVRQFCPALKSYSHNFKLGKVTEKRYQLCASYFPSFLQQNQNHQQVTWHPYEVIMDLAINSTVKLPRNQK